VPEVVTAPVSVLPPSHNATVPSGDCDDSRSEERSAPHKLGPRRIVSYLSDALSTKDFPTRGIDGHPKSLNDRVVLAGRFTVWPNRS
jgi:hypothetical protein